MDTCVKVYGEKRRFINEDWQKVVCYVSYRNHKDHRKIVEDSFRDHLRLDLEYMKQNYADHFIEPHNVGRAILLYHYFRDRHCFFNETKWETIPLRSLPVDEPDEMGLCYKLWVLEG